METKKILAILGMSTVLLASFVLVAPVSAPPGTYSYKVMGGVITSSTQMGEPGGGGTQYEKSFWDIPFSQPRNASPYVTPAVGGYDIVFGSPDGNGVVPLTVPAASWTGFWHAFWNGETQTYFNLTVLMNEDGYGWLFTQANADVDVITYNDNNGVYWLSGPEADNPVLPPDVGADGIAGTGDTGDGFGDGDLDLAGSSILWLNLTLHVEYYIPPPTDDWGVLFEAPWPCLMTTETASDIVDEPLSELDGISTGNLEGKPWEYAFSGEPWANDKSNYYVEYVAAWSVLNLAVEFNQIAMELDVLFRWDQLLLREDCEINTGAGTKTGYQHLMGDGTTAYPAIYPPGSFGDFKVGWQDLFSLAGAYGSQDESFGQQEADGNYDARFDLTSTFGDWDSKIGWQDLFALAGNYGNTLKGP